MPSSESDDRREVRTFVKIAVAFTALLVVMTGAFALMYRPPPKSTLAASRAAQSGMPALDLPDGGRTPTSPGDPGGWQQLALLGVLVVAIGGGAGALVLSSRRAKRRAASAVEDVGEQGVERAPDH
ncbi:MAG TPA: hypothetical protein VFN04_00790 [Protaetiibacter sp.]|jgi:hypothetical protein|nr:hypothetical protein [Protaetiibacter sp.]